MNALRRFVGKLYNSVDMTVSIQGEKISEITELFVQFRNRKTCSKRDLQVLIGKLAFTAECVRGGRLFIA